MSNTVQAEPGTIIVPGMAGVTEKDIEKAVEKAVSRHAPTAWGRKKRPEDDYFELDLPSGQCCLLKKLDPMALIEHDMIDEIDFFSRKLFPEKVDAQGKPIDRPEEQTSFLKMLSDPKKRERFYNLLDSLLEIALVEPKVVKKLPEEGEASLPKDTVWAGNIDLEDKMHIFAVLNDPQEAINRFRQQQNASVANVEPSKDVPQTAE